MAVTDIRELSISISLDDEDLVNKLTTINELVEATTIHFQGLSDEIERFEQRQIEFPGPQSGAEIRELEYAYVSEPPTREDEIPGVYLEPVEELPPLVPVPRFAREVPQEEPGVPGGVDVSPTLVNEELLEERERLFNERLDEERQLVREQVEALSDVSKHLTARPTRGRILQETAEEIAGRVFESLSAVEQTRARIMEEQDPELQLRLLQENERIFTRLQTIARNIEQRFGRLEVIGERGGESLGLLEDVIPGLEGLAGLARGLVPQRFEPEDVAGLEAPQRFFGESEDLERMLTAIEEQQAFLRGAQITEETAAPVVETAPMEDLEIQPEIVMEPEEEVGEPLGQEALERVVREEEVIQINLEDNRTFEFTGAELAETTSEAGLERFREIFAEASEEARQQLVRSIVEAVRRVRRQRGGG